MKKLFVLILCLAMCFSGNVFAYTFPNGFFDLNNKYIAAAEKNDYRGMIEYGTKIINMMANEPDCDEKRNVMISRFNGVSGAYEALGDYDMAAVWYGKFYDYAIAFGDKYYDYTRPAHDKSLQYKSRVVMFTDGGEDVYYGAKNERKDGVLYGLCSDSEIRENIPDKSMILLYHELGDPISGYERRIMQEAQSGGKAVEFALNCKNEGDDIANIGSFEGNLSEISSFISEFGSVPVYLRFAAEFDVWERPTDSGSFKSAFRWVSNYFKAKNGNIAMVWSLTPSASWGVNIDDFYPGDDVVDWVGTTLYSQKYFKADKNSPALDTLLFKCGNSSDPVLAIYDLIQKYGSKKPIMISESGSGHKIMSTGEDTVDFALTRLKQMMYYVPMFYPQVKLMAYFDRYIEGSGEKSDYRLSNNASMEFEYTKAIKKYRYVQGSFGGEANGSAFRALEKNGGVDRVFPLYCYAHKYAAEAKSVTYFVDGVYAATSNEIPFEAYVDLSKLPGSNHCVKAVALFSDGTTVETENQISLSGAVSGDISVEISGEKVEFDSNPLICRSRTMVPMRKIFEELGADVSWDGNTQTITGTKGYKTVKMTIGSRFMYVDGEKKELDAVPIIIDGRTLVPVRAIAEGMGCEVSWNDEIKTVGIRPI